LAGQNVQRAIPKRTALLLVEVERKDFFVTEAGVGLAREIHAHIAVVEVVLDLAACALLDLRECDDLAVLAEEGDRTLVHTERTAFHFVELHRVFDFQDSVERSRIDERPKTVRQLEIAFLIGHRNSLLADADCAGGLVFLSSISIFPSPVA